MGSPPRLSPPCENRIAVRQNRSAPADIIYDGGGHVFRRGRFSRGRFHFVTRGGPASVFKGNLLQFCSSERSPQSLSASQTQDARIQRPLSHWNWSSVHALQTQHTLAYTIPSDVYIYYSYSPIFLNMRAQICILFTEWYNYVPEARLAASDDSSRDNKMSILWLHWSL